MYSPDTEFEDRVKKLKPECMPAPYAVVVESYTYRVLEKIYDQCAPAHYAPDSEGYMKSNVSPEQVDKYTILAFSAMLDPSGFTAAFTGGELASDGVKCLLKTFVDASTEMDKSQKELFKGVVDSGFTIKDWYEFASGIPEMASEFDMNAAESGVKTLLALHDRAPEGMSFAQSVGAAYGVGVTELKEWHDGPRKTAWRKAKESFDRCEFDEALDQMLDTKKVAQKECLAGGDSYRQAQRNLRAHEAGGLSSDVDAMLAHSAKKGALQSHKERFEELIDFYEKLEKFESGFEKAQNNFLERRKDYKDLASKAMRGGGSEDSCKALQELDNLISPKNLSPNCRSEFFNDDPAAMPLPYDLARDLARINYGRFDNWQAALAKITTLHHQCLEVERDAAMQSLRAEIKANPIFQWVGGECRSKDQSAILTELDKMKYAVSPYCETTIVPNGLLGLSISKASKLLEDAKLYVEGDLVRIEAQEGQVPNTVIASDPAPGKAIRIWTGVKLTVAKSAPAVVLVEMPEVIGLEGGKAVDLVRSVGLNADVSENAPADKPEMKPGFVYATTASSKAELPIGTTVILSTYGERPLIEVPSVAKQSTTTAMDILKGAGFVATEPSVGLPAPEADKVGKVYSSSPPAPEMHPMFTPVSPLIYGPVKVILIPVPAMKGMSLFDAVGQLGAHGDHFVYGDVALSKDRPEGSVLGTVYYSVPGAGEPVPAGTKVTLHVYPPVGDEIGNSRTISFAILGKPEKQAAGVLRGKDDFFVVPEAKDGDVAQGNQVPGTVQYSAPSAGSVGLRGSAVQLYTYTAPPLTEDETPTAEIGTEDPEQTDEDGSWIGRWKVSGFLELKGKKTELDGMLDISASNGRFLVKWMQLRDGEYKKPTGLLMHSDANNVLRTAPEALKELAEKEFKKNPNAGSLEKALEQSANFFTQIIRTLEIARDGNQCWLSASDPKEGRVKIDFTCIRQ